MIDEDKDVGPAPGHPTPEGETACKVAVHDAIGSIAAEAWDKLANPRPETANPFISHAFLASLEEAGTVGGRTGWLPRHLALIDAHGTMIGAMPAYLKLHSRGEYVFDQGWADAYHRAGGSYYPKLLCAVPFTPVPGPRILLGDAAPDEARERELLLASAAVELAERMELSSVHLTFPDEGMWHRLGAAGFLQRTDQQFHFTNAGYRSFDDFLASLASRKRKAIRREREEAVAAGLEIRWLSGADLREDHWDAFFAFYMDTGSRKWGTPYLNRAFFSLIGERMADRCLLIMAFRDGTPIAGALNLIGGDCLYGRYWGANEHHPCLHFELCYYQAIEFAIAKGLARVEAGAQGDHKIARGYMPTTTYSLHWFADPGLGRAVARYLADERRHVAHTQAVLSELAPFRREATASPAASEPPDHD
ncbi:MAG: GNAT family N-acetyltransferase [Hyphomicrobiaceae bacterium]|nr:GNAT family N-acetyltransferase [Hyphomicrobiaceae bacterium]